MRQYWLIVRIALDIRIAARAGNAAQNRDVRTGSASDKQQHGNEHGEDDAFQNRQAAAPRQKPPSQARNS